jgi:hypothetical protein
MTPTLILAASQGLTSSEQAIVDEVISAKSIEELVLLGQRLDFLHAFSQYALYFGIALAFVLLFQALSMPRIKLFFELVSSVVLLFLPSIPLRFPDDSIQSIPLFFTLGVAGVIIYGLSFLKALFGGSKLESPIEPATDSTVDDKEI